MHRAVISAPLLVLAIGYAAAESLDPAPGTLLVAQRHLGDPNFERTVVLLIDYDASGAFGLVLNRRTDTTLGELVPDAGDAARLPVYIGGPVERSTLHALIESGEEPDGSRPVFGDIHYGRSRSLFRTLLEEGSVAGRYRVFSGYSGWAAGQLDAEIERGDWLVLEADEDVVFWQDTQELWRRIAPADMREWAGLFGCCDEDAVVHHDVVDEVLMLPAVPVVAVDAVLAQ